MVQLRTTCSPISDYGNFLASWTLRRVWCSARAVGFQISAKLMKWISSNIVGLWDKTFKFQRMKSPRKTAHNLNLVVSQRLLKIAEWSMPKKLKQRYQVFLHFRFSWWIFAFPRIQKCLFSFLLFCLTAPLEDSGCFGFSPLEICWLFLIPQRVVRVLVRKLRNFQPVWNPSIFCNSCCTGLASKFPLVIESKWC